MLNFERNENASESNLKDGGQSRLARKKSFNEFTLVVLTPDGKEVLQCYATESYTSTLPLALHHITPQNALICEFTSKIL